ncbi:hypothetical protein KEU06_17710 [Pseudaminobacter sp. 19-2017]|uniref:Uncharacterized protein n=1 Tax=Pseudaminobacter soli (ex Zhang et al. 2022) TaxID=2831468 RepID=A0A942DYB6_9HYPH|nr:hypothetical protein [Pseudaminobacter soli]MBS3650454.1 hypothetical protein [Pseudaminobacter soli]
MKELPKDIDPDLVMAVGRYLDDHGRSTPVSLGVAIPEIRTRYSTRLSNKALEELILQMAATRGLSVLLDNRR